MAIEMENDTFIRACRKEEVDHTPIWLMRQAGRYIPEYRKLRENHGIIEIYKNPEMASDVSAMPIEMFGLDAAIIFQDLMTPLEPAGIKFKLVDSVGPVVSNPIKSRRDVNGIRLYDTEELGFVRDEIGMLKGKVGVPVIGFAGGPFTIACYLIEGLRSNDRDALSAFMKNNNALIVPLMDRIADIVINYLNMQVAAGADAIQLFDTWSGALDRQSYSSHVAPYVRKIFSSVKGNVPKIYFTLESSHIIDVIAQSGCDVISVGWHEELINSWSSINFSMPIQGNMAPGELARGGEAARNSALHILDAVGRRKGHIFNLGHGVLPDTNPMDVKKLVELVHSYSTRG